MSGLVTIKNRRDFLVANAKARRVVTSCAIVQIVERASDHPIQDIPRVGFTVTKKMGNAVIRNRIKRRLREAVRKHVDKMLPGHDYVFISRHKALDCPFTDLLRDIEFAFSQIAGKK